MMKNALRKVTAIASALAMSLGLLVATAAPASARAVPRVAADAVQVAVINIPFDVDYSCADPDPNVTTDNGGTWFLEPDMEMPPGLAFDAADGHIKGTPTTLGSYKLPLLKCLQGAGTAQPFYEGLRVGYINIVEPFTPAPTLTGVALNDASCSAKLVGVLPKTPDASTVVLSFVSANESSSLTLRNFAASELIDLTIPMNDLAIWAQSSSDVLSSTVNGDADYCNTDVTVTLAYQYGGAPVATDAVSLHPRKIQTEPTLFVSTVLDQACTIRVTGTVTRHSDDDMIKFVASMGTGGIDLMLKNIKPDTALDVTLKLDDLDSLTNNSGVHSVFPWGEPVICENLGWAAGVYVNGIQFGVTVKSTAWLRGECPAGQYGKIVATDTLIYRDCIPAPPGHIVPEANVLSEPVPCDDGTYADATGLSACKVAEPGYYVDRFGQAFPSECMAGTYASDYGQNRCLDAPKGYYVDQMGATSATQCPAGFTTMTEGSMNAWNCYRDDDTMCLPGSYSATGYEPCTVAAPGFYVPFDGARNQIPCDVGTYSDTAGASSCVKAAKGYFVNKTGATSATKCAAGLTTELPGSRSKNECYKQKFQTAKAINTPTKLKFGGKFETAGRADAGLNLNAVATGSCTLTATTKTVKINGKSVKQPRWVIKATKKAGNCKVTFSNAGDYTYKPFSVTKTIKVTKTGK